MLSSEPAMRHRCCLQHASRAEAEGILTGTLPTRLVCVRAQAQTLKESQARKTDVENNGPKMGLLGRLSRGITKRFDMLSHSLRSFNSMTFRRPAEGSPARNQFTSNRVMPGQG
jgi:hypothetical protein